MNSLNEFYQTLEKLISYPSVATDEKGNKQALGLLKDQLESIGFEVVIEYKDNETFQPVIIAKLETESVKKVVLYNHYDVEKIESLDNWDSPPFKLTKKEGRLFARGIADNKASLLARLFTIKIMLENEAHLPNILWLIQGEEEVISDLADKVFPQYIQDFGADIYLEETGYNRNGKPILFYQNLKSDTKLIDNLNEHLFEGKAKIEKRHMTKFSKCPFISNIPQQSIYIGFGANDYSANIHKENESIDIFLLEDNMQVFKKFINWVQNLKL